MISKTISRICYEDPSLIENYEKAIADIINVWECHHRVETIMNCTHKELIAKGAYWKRPAHDLIFLTVSDHTKLHQNDAIKEKNRKSHLGKKASSSTRAKMSAAHAGNKSTTGMHWWTNGVQSIPAFDCPGPGWHRGRGSLKRKS